jgi:adenylate kinase
MGTKIDHVIDVDCPDANIVKRLSGRRACIKCGATYHTEHLKPKVEGICDVCGSELVLRDDDKPETVIKRLQVYHEQTQPLIEYYKDKNVLVSVDGKLPIEDTFEIIVDILGDR